MNVYDSDFLAQTLIACGFLPVDDPESANLILLNTCAVRAKAEQKAFSFLGRMARLKRRNPETRLGVVGCLAQKEGKQLAVRFPYVDFVVGPRELGQVKGILNGGEGAPKKVVATSLKPLPPPPVVHPGYFESKVTGFISIMQGCNNFCSYCVVPYVRGREVSKPPEAILSEAERLLAQGVREITLLGQNVNSYQWQDKNQWDFSRLLHRMGALKGLSRLRFTTSHPKDLSDDLIRCFSDIDRLCPHIHLPFQAGSDRILKIMRRGYTREHYLRLIQKLREAVPDMAITADVMVGFPGEREEDFMLTLDLIKNVQFDSLFSFIYSDREGTKASLMEAKIDEDIKGSRLRTLQKLQKEITLQKNKGLEGRMLEVLVEGVSKKGEFTGRTLTNKVTNFNSNTNYIGHTVNVLIKNGFPNSLWAEHIE